MTDSMRFSPSSARVISALTLLLIAGCATSTAQDSTAPTGAPVQLKHGVDLTTNPAGRPNAAPIANLTYYGGRIVSHPIYYNIYWGMHVATYSGGIDLFMTDLGTLEFNFGGYTAIHPAVLIRDLLGVDA